MGNFPIFIVQVPNILLFSTWFQKVFSPNFDYLKLTHKTKPHSRADTEHVKVMISQSQIV